ncbi:nitrite reductase small subunit NirD [Psychrobacter sp. DM4]|uniref:nitrite reductase small subunit NirD n=1 Tax=Psychrobacter sp. DM4 TaxID=3440637 RepID=UPI003F4FCB0F
MIQHTVCQLNDILPETGVCALIEGKQIAIFRTKQDDLFALDNYDPFSQANVLSRGLIGGTTIADDTGGTEEVLYVASPIYKQRFNLATGHCLDDESVKLDIYRVGLENSKVVVSTHKV